MTHLAGIVADVQSLGKKAISIDCHGVFCKYMMKGGWQWAKAAM